ncbi:hypothetical protein FIBSPDRAFT_867642, partial [Athelia psychrophila]
MCTRATRAMISLAFTSRALLVQWGSLHSHRRDSNVVVFMLWIVSMHCGRESFSLHDALAGQPHTHPRPRGLSAYLSRSSTAHANHPSRRHCSPRRRSLQLECASLHPATSAPGVQTKLWLRGLCMYCGGVVFLFAMQGLKGSKMISSRHVYQVPFFCILTRCIRPPEAPVLPAFASGSYISPVLKDGDRRLWIDAFEVHRAELAQVKWRILTRC